MEQATKKKTYAHLTRDDRVTIGVMLELGHRQYEIAAKLGVDPGTVSREIKRNGGRSKYCGVLAHEESARRRHAASSEPRKLTDSVWLQTADLLRSGWSPEQIGGRLQLLDMPTIGSTWIYYQVRADRQSGGDLYKHLRHRGKKKNWRGGRRSGRGLIPDRRDIKDRPPVVDRKIRFGDWEGDTIIGVQHSGAIVTLVDRRSKYLLMRRVDRRTSELVTTAVSDLLSNAARTVQTITFDNGKEFAGHKAIAKATGADVYFATPYHSWERGLNEHTNGLIRGSFPKDTDFRRVSGAEVQRVQDSLNDRPRKVLNYLTPREVFMGYQPPGLAGTSA